MLQTNNTVYDSFIILQKSAFPLRKLRKFVKKLAKLKIFLVTLEAYRFDKGTLLATISHFSYDADKAVTEAYLIHKF